VYHSKVETLMTKAVEAGASAIITERLSAARDGLQIRT